MEYKKKCVSCGGDFIAQRRDGKTCSVKCRKEWKHMRSENRKKNGKVLVECDVCGKSFVKRIGFLKRCSRECSAKASNDRESKRKLELRRKENPIKPRTCVFCGKSYMSPMNRKTCSTECSTEYKLKRARERGREYLKNGVEHRHTGVGRGQDQRGSKNPNFKDGHTTYSYTGFSRLPHLCNRCGSTDFLLVHHKDHNRLNANPWNLEILCKRCHQDHHSLRDDKTGRYISPNNTKG